MSVVLVVDDKELMRDSVGATLQRAGFEVMTADGADGAIEAVSRRRPDALVTDLRMPGQSGLELLERVRRIDDELPVVVMTAFAGVDTAVQAIKLGAFDYITKPFEGDELVIAIKRAIGHAALARENAVLRAGGEAEAVARAATDASGRTGLDRLIGASPAMRRVKEQVLAVAESQGTVMVCGESGSGKEVVARAIHELSPRRSAPFLAVNCAALSESLLESELFGHERGAFTGAERLRKGRFELADRGTILLDEVSEVGPHVQAKLLRVLQERAFERVGSSVTIGVDVRVIATSNRDLVRAVARGAFRQDLFFRLNVLPIHLPPLRDRPEDVPALAERFAEDFCRREGRQPVRFDAEALALMQAYPWPGNVRELQNICERAVVLIGARDERLGRGAEGVRSLGRDLIEPWLAATGAWPAGAGVAESVALVEPKPVTLSNGAHGLGANGVPVTGHGSAAPGAHGHGAPPEAAGRVRLLEEIEREAIVEALRRFNGHRQKTARALGIGVRTLGLKLKKWKQDRLVAESL